MQAEIKELRNGNRVTQHKVYARFAPKMLAVCRTYISDLNVAENLMIQGFFKVFTKIDQFNEKGSFEGWIRKIMVRECLNELRKKQRLLFVEEENFKEEALEDEPDIPFRADEVLDDLPDGYRAVFNMFVLEGYSHKEIADEIGININTSKSQLRKAKEKVREIILSKYQKEQSHVKN